MNKFIALTFLVMLMFALVPGLKIISFTHTAIAANYVIVTFILNETKTVSFMYYTDGGLSYDYATFNQSEYFVIPADTEIYIYSAYPFEVNVKDAVYNPATWEYEYDLYIKNSTTIYIDFLPKSPHYNVSLPQPVTTINLSSTSQESIEFSVSKFIYAFLLILIIVALIVILIAKKLKS